LIISLAFWEVSQYAKILRKVPLLTDLAEDEQKFLGPDYAKIH
jgi:hypothetical protein